RLDQAWFLDKLPDLTAPIRCVMPLYAGAFRSPITFRAAFAMEAALVAASGAAGRTPPGRVWSRAAVGQLAHVRQEGLVAAAEWHDVELLDPAAAMQRLANALTGLGGALIEHAQVERITVSESAAKGVQGVFR